MSTVVVTLIGKPGCHLCETALTVVSDVLDALPAGCLVSLVELSLDDDPAFLAKYQEKIPVVLVDGRDHSVWRVEPDRLRRAILEAAS